MFFSTNFDYYKNYICGEAKLITDTTILNNVGGKVGLMTHESNIVLFVL